MLTLGMALTLKQPHLVDTYKLERLGSLLRMQSAILWISASFHHRRRAKKADAENINRQLESKLFNSQKSKKPDDWRRS